MKKPSIAMVLTLVSGPTLAMFCPVGFNQISIGDTIDQVIQQCGKPDAKKTTKQVPTKPQEWNYYVKPDPTQPSTLKMAIVFDASGKVININVNGQALTTSTICGNPVNLGDSTDSVKTACGSPLFTNQGEQVGAPSAPPIEITEFKYNTSPPTTYLFENGKLKERQR